MKHALWIGAAVFALTAANASAAILVIGGAAAQSCYESATAQRYTRDDVETCSLALSEEPLNRRDRAATLINRGIIYLHRSDNDRALADFDAAIALQPDLAEGYTNRAAALLETRDYRGALDAVARSLSLSPREPEKVYYMSGVAHEELGEIAAAYHDYRQAAEIAPDWPVVQRELARFRVSAR
jgi:tetratricopeptide (TPR) repeat protein